MCGGRFHPVVPGQSSMSKHTGAMWRKVTKKNKVEYKPARDRKRKTQKNKWKIMSIGTNTGYLIIVYNPVQNAFP